MSNDFVVVVVVVVVVRSFVCSRSLSIDKWWYVVGVVVGVVVVVVVVCAYGRMEWMMQKDGVDDVCGRHAMSM